MTAQLTKPSSTSSTSSASSASTRRHAQRVDSAGKRHPIYALAVTRRPIYALAVTRRPAGKKRNLLDDDKHLVDWNDGGLHVQVDWDGGSNHGTFAVKIDETWTRVAHTETCGPNEQLVSRTEHVTCVHVARGPHNAGVRFAAKLIPIEWTKAPALAEHSASVAREPIGEAEGCDYTYRYADGVTSETVEWQESREVDGAHRLTLQNLIIGRDYEMWVRLWHPSGADRWTDQDPVIRTDGSNPNPGN
jgi:hypothetical protein